MVPIWRGARNQEFILMLEKYLENAAKEMV